MRTSALSLLALVAASPTAVLGGTYAKASNGKLVGSLVDPEMSASVGLWDGTKYASTVQINNKTEFVIDTFTYGVTFDPSLVSTFLGPANLTEFDFNTPPAATTSTGFSWSKNGTLQVDHKGFYGWASCTISGDTRLYWAQAPIKDLSNECEAITLAKWESD